MFWWGWAVMVKEQRILVGSDFFQTWKLSSWKPYLCLVTHSYSDKLVLRRIQYFIANIWCIDCAQIFNFTIFLEPIPIPTHDEMSVGSVEKCTKHLQVITITFPCKQPIMKHDMDKFNLTQFECRIRNLINLKVNRKELYGFFLLLSF